MSADDALIFRFVAQGGLGAWAIEWFGHGGRGARYSHVDLILPDGRALGARSDRVGRDPAGRRIDAGVQIRPADYARFTRSLTIALPMPHYCVERGLRWAHEQIGRPYDWQAIVAFFVDRDWRDSGAWICSELGHCIVERGGYWAWITAGRRRFLPIERSKITPADLLVEWAPHYEIVARC